MDLNFILAIAVAVVFIVMSVLLRRTAYPKLKLAHYTFAFLCAMYLVIDGFLSPDKKAIYFPLVLLLIVSYRAVTEYKKQSI
jgi:Ca2+/Na+ antiporter